MAIEFAGAQLHAADLTWNAGGDAYSWSDANNWGGTAPVASDSLFFGGSSGLNNYNDIAANTAFGGITFNNGASGFTLTGNAIKLGAGITNNSSALQDIQLDIGLSAASDVYASGDIAIDASVNSSSSKYPLVKYGPGTLTLGGSADNGYGSATVYEGTLVLAKASTGSIHALGGNIDVSTNGTLRIAGTGGDQIYYNANFVMDGGLLQVQADEEIKSLNGTGTIENGLANSTNTFNLQSNHGNRGVFDGIIRDNGGVLNIELHRDDNIQVLNGTNTYSGTTVVDNTHGSKTSRLIVNALHTGGGAYTVYGNAGDPAALGGSGTISASEVDINDNGILAPGGALSGSTYSDTTAILTISNAVNLNSANATLSVDLNGSTAGSGYDQVNIAGSGSLSNNAANLELNLGYTPAAGDEFTIVKVQGTNPANDVGTFSALNGVPTDLSQDAIFTDPTTGKRFQISYTAEGSTLDGGGNDIMLKVLADASAALTWRGDGVNNTWDIGTTADWWDGTNLVTFNNNGVSFDDSGSNNIPVNLTAAVTPTSVQVDATNDYVIAGSGSLTGTVSFTKTNTGTMAIATDNTGLTGVTVIKGGTLQIGTNGTTGSWSGTVNVLDGGVLAYKRSDDVTLGWGFNGAGGFVHNGSGSLIINTAIPFSGHTTNSGGLLQLGDGTSTTGSIGGDIHVDGTNVLRYYYNSDATTANTISGNGTVLWDEPLSSATASFYSIGSTVSSPDFTGTNIIGFGVVVHAQNNNPGYALGSNSVVIVTNQYSQVWLDQCSVDYNQSFIISGDGTPVVAPYDGTPPYGAIKMYRATLSGSITLAGDARIGGSATGGTISGQIIGNGHQLDIYGDNMVGYPFVLGLSCSSNNWGSTLISWGSLRALADGSISTNAMTINLNGQLHVYGNTVSVNSLNDGMDGAGVVYNMSTSAAGTLVVGADGSSSTFDGTFGDGASKPLNLTKVGAGTLTLTTVNTNTGTVAVNGGTLALVGSGSFDNASVISVGNGATYDVTGASGTLALNAGQTLKHGGSSVGAINIAGNVSMGSGTLLLGLNRTNTPATNDTLAVSGTFTAGGTLSVTNLGPALHVGDSFQLFSSGVSGFTYNLETNDVANNVTYTWNNTVSTDGKITVASVTTSVNPNPPQLQVSVSGGTLSLAWPTNSGWTLLTNSVGLTATNQWFPYPNSANLTNVDITIDPVQTNVFFKMAYPYP